MFCEGMEAVRGILQYIWEYRRVHGAKSIKFVRTEGCEHAAGFVLAEKGSLEMCPSIIQPLKRKND